MAFRETKEVERPVGDGDVSKLPAGPHEARNAGTTSWVDRRVDKGGDRSESEPVDSPSRCSANGQKEEKRALGDERKKERE
jgi:hypothetical protein